MLLFSCVDLPAQALMLNMKQFNGRWGCNWREDEGVPCATSHLHRNWPYKPSVVLRTHQSMLKNAHDSRACSSVSSGINKTLCSLKSLICPQPVLVFYIIALILTGQRS